MAARRTKLLREAQPLTTPISVYMPPVLKDLVGRAADDANLPMSEWIVRACAEKIGRPELGVVPRKRPGRHRNPVPA